METRGFNPVNFLISMAVGWFLLSFLHSAVRSLLAGDWGNLVPGFKTIAFFHDGRATLINVVIIVSIGIVTNVLWSLAHRR
jgi:hypothetical protein